KVSVKLRRHVESRIVYPCIPGLQNHERRLGNEPPPLLRIKQHDYEEDAREDKPINVKKMPRAGNADGMPVARCGNDGRDVTSILLRRPHAIRRNVDWCEANPLASRCAVIVEVEARMIDKNRETAPDQHHHKNKVEEVAVAHPQRKAVWAGKVIRIDLWDRWNIWKSKKKELNPCREHGEQNQHNSRNQERGPNPDAKAAIWRIMNG